MSITTQAAPPPGSSAATGDATRTVLRFIGKYGTLLFLLGMIIVFSALRPTVFPTASNLLLVLNSIALVAIISGGLTLVLVVGEFDLTIGSLASLAGIIGVSLIVSQGLPVPSALLVAIGFEALVGLFNATVVTKAGVNALVATLGTGSVLIGMNYIITSGRPLAITDPFFSSIALGKVFFGIPNLVVIMAIVYVVLWIILNRTDVGFQMQAVGGNAEAARMSGNLNRPGQDAGLRDLRDVRRTGGHAALRTTRQRSGCGWRWRTRSMPSRLASSVRRSCAMASSTSWARSSVRSP